MQVRPESDALVNHTVYAEWGQIWWQNHMAGKGHIQTKGLRGSLLNPKL